MLVLQLVASLSLLIVIYNLYQASCVADICFALEVDGLLRDDGPLTHLNHASRLVSTGRWKWLRLNKRLRTIVYDGPERVFVAV